MSGSAKRVSYDMRSPDDLLFGLGSGCEGAMDILLVRLDAADGWQPLSRLDESWRAERAESMALVVESIDPLLPSGSGMFPSDGWVWGCQSDLRNAARGRLVELCKVHALNGCTRFVPDSLTGIDLLWLRQAPPHRVLLLGAGQDAEPVFEFGRKLGWSITVIDHRSHYTQTRRFPGATAVLDGGPAALAEILTGPRRFAAAVVMSHHLASDRAYLRTLATSNVPYVGLLGPAARRERLLTDLASDVVLLQGRLRAPVGLDLGADTPEGIALAIVAEIHAALTGRMVPGPMSKLAK